MKVQLLYFHRAKEAAGCPGDTAVLSAVATAADALDWAIQRHPAMQPFRTLLRIAVNEEYVNLDHSLNEGDVIALLPPVSGG